MKFDVVKFCNTYGIPYVDTGKNVTRGDIGMRCPWCGPSDPSEHLGVDRETGAYNCWRNPGHRGKTPHGLIQKLLRCSRREAEAIVGDQSPEIDDFDEVLRELQFGDEAMDAPPTELPDLSRYYRLCPDNVPLCARFINYLINRGFPPSDAWEVAQDYDLHYALTGAFADRLIYPIYDPYDGRLVSWTARSIKTDPKVRYKALSPKPDAPERQDGHRAVMAPTDCLGNADQAMEDEGEVLVVVEGFLDMLKLDYYAVPYEARVVCLFHLDVSVRQIDILADLSHHYDSVALMLDSGEDAVAMRLTEKLAVHIHNIGDPIELPPDVKDPGDLAPEDIDDLLGT